MIDSNSFSAYGNVKLVMRYVMRSRGARDKWQVNKGLTTCFRTEEGSHVKCHSWGMSRTGNSWSRDATVLEERRKASVLEHSDCWGERGWTQCSRRGRLQVDLQCRE